jgi:putative DNA primase/helicase
MNAFHNFLSKLSAHGYMVSMQKGGKSAMAMCPGHEDNKQSLSVGQNHKGDALLNCFAGCPTPDIVKLLGMSMPDLFADQADMQPDTGQPKIVAIYPYVNEDGELQNEVVRTDPKGFRQRRPDGKGGFIWNIDGVKRYMYRLPDLKRATLLVEGEKDADALWKLKLPATTTLGGSSAWRPEFAEQLVDAGVKRLGVLPDNDAPGLKYAYAVAKDCQEAGISVSIIQLPGLGPKEDVSDFISRAAHPRGDLIRAIQAFQSHPTAPLSDDADLAAALEGVPEGTQRRRAARLRRPADLDPTKTSFLIDGLIPAGWFGEIAGRDGRGKTLLALHIAKSVLTGEKLFGTFDVVKTGPVVMYMLDDPENLVRERIEQHGLLNHPDLHVGTEADLDKNDPNLFADLAELCLEIKPALVIVDALYLFTPESKRDMDQANSSGAMGPIMIAFNKICSETGATVALVAHDNKAGSDVAGSQVVRNMAKWILRMALPKQYEKDKQGGRTTGDRILELDKLKVSSSKTWGMTISTGDKGEAHFEIVPLDQVEKKSKAGKTVAELAERRQYVVDWLRFLLEPGARTSTEVHEAALEAKIKKRELNDKGVMELAGVEKSHDHPDSPWVWKLKA